MFPDTVLAQRQEFVTQVAAAPPTYLDDNFAALMRIIGELQASLALELQVIQGIKRLQLDDVKSLTDYFNKFSDYVDSRGFDLEKTSCSRISDVYWNQIRSRDGAYSSSEQIKELDELLNIFTTADSEFTEEIETFMDGSLDKVRQMRDAASEGRIDDARQVQQEYADEYRAQVDRLKAAISDLSESGTSLIHRL
jgi:hypothetical protein